MASMMEDLDLASSERKASDFVRKLSKFEMSPSLFLRMREDKMFLHFTEVAGIDVAVLDDLTLPTPYLPLESSPRIIEMRKKPLRS